MYKKTIALCALAGFGGGACAQSSVTIYGLLDAYATRFTGAPGGVNASNQALKRLESGGMTTSRFGIRGKEDLGDGLTAGFELSSFIRVDTGQNGRSDAVGAIAADPFWSREASVNVTSPTFGRIRLGNFSTPMFVQSLGSNAFLSSTVFSPINVVTFIGSPLSGGTGWTNQIGYDSPVWSGFSFSGSVSAAEGQNGRNGSAQVGYAGGPFSVSLAWQTVKKDPLTFADGTSPNNTKAWQLAASYNFNVVKVYGHIGQIQNDGTEAAPLDVKYKIWDLSASVPIGVGSVLVAYANRKTDDGVAPAAATAFGGNKKREVYSIGYDYFLSKRTDVYAVVMHDKTLSNTLPAPGRLIDASATNVGVGIRHNF
jgi:predicted porin